MSFVMVVGLEKELGMYRYINLWLLSGKICSIRQAHESYILPTPQTIYRNKLPIMVSIKQLALLALTTGLATVDAQSTGKTTRYWDCCKGSCAWSGKAPVNKPIATCDKNDNPLTNVNAKSGCESGGEAFMCTNQSPWAVNDNLAYGFAAVKLAGKTESDWCCACYEYVVSRLLYRLLKNRILTCTPTE
jgi:hypothetical protein